MKFKNPNSWIVKWTKETKIDKNLNIIQNKIEWIQEIMNNVWISSIIKYNKALSSLNLIWKNDILMNDKEPHNSISENKKLFHNEYIKWNSRFINIDYRELKILINEYKDFKEENIKVFWESQEFWKVIIKWMDLWDKTKWELESFFENMDSMDFPLMFLWDNNYLWEFTLANKGIPFYKFSKMKEWFVKWTHYDILSWVLMYQWKINTWERASLINEINEEILTNGLVEWVAKISHIPLDELKEKYKDIKEKSDNLFSSDISDFDSLEKEILWQINSFWINSKTLYSISNLDNFNVDWKSFWNWFINQNQDKIDYLIEISKIDASLWRWIKDLRNKRINDYLEWKNEKQRNLFHNILEDNENNIDITIEKFEEILETFS